MVLEYSVDAAGFHRYVWQQPSGAVFHLKFKQAKGNAALAAVADEREADEQYQNERPAIQADDGRAPYVRELVELIKQRPTLTAAQFNTYLNGKQWFEAVELRHLVYLIASALAERGEVQLAGSTEAQAFNAVRNFIRNTPARRLAKLFLNQNDL